MGRWNETDVRIFRVDVECVPARAAFLAALAFVSFAEAEDLAGVDALAAGFLVVAISKGMQWSATSSTSKCDPAQN